MIKIPVITLLAAGAIADDCMGPYPAHSCCQARMDWMGKHHDFVKVGKNRCDWQAHLAKDKWCPTPGFAIPDALAGYRHEFTPGQDKPIELKVYRAAASDDPYATTLGNNDAADYSGVLSYLHSEVVPKDQQNEPYKTNCQRRNDIDAVIVFNVTIYPSPKVQKRIPPLGGFVSYQNGICDVKNCDAKLEADGYTPGYQSQDSNPRANYSKYSYWYSFPQDGLCPPNKVPDGETCTYNYKVWGKVPVDTLIDLPRVTDEPNFDKYCKSIGYDEEFIRASQDPEGACDTIGGFPFWWGPCDLANSTQRIEALLRADKIPVESIPNVTVPECTADLPDVPTPGPGGGGGGDGGNDSSALIPAIIGSVVGVAVLGALGYFCMCRGKTSKESKGQEPLLNTDAI